MSKNLGGSDIPEPPNGFGIRRKKERREKEKNERRGKEKRKEEKEKKEREKRGRGEKRREKGKIAWDGAVRRG